MYAAVAGQSKAKAEALGTQPGQPGVTRPLPNAHLNALAGLLEKLAEEGGRVDLYRIGGALVLEIDDLLPIVEAGELLGFITRAGRRSATHSAWSGLCRCHHSGPQSDYRRTGFAPSRSSPGSMKRYSQTKISASPGTISTKSCKPNSAI